MEISKIKRESTLGKTHAHTHTSTYGRKCIQLEGCSNVNMKAGEKKCVARSLIMLIVQQLCPTIRHHAVCRVAPEFAMSIDSNAIDFVRALAVNLQHTHTAHTAHSTLFGCHLPHAKQRAHGKLHGCLDLGEMAELCVELMQMQNKGKFFRRQNTPQNAPQSYPFGRECRVCGVGVIFLSIACDSFQWQENITETDENGRL